MPNNNKTIYLLRHAKSSWKNTGISDKKRPLNQRGIRNIGEMGRRLSDQGFHPDLVLSSPAKRALTTACGIADAVGFSSNKIQVMETLYFAGIAAQLAELSQLDDKIQSVLLVGHNPDISTLLHELCGSEEDMPTCAFAAITFACDRWADIPATPGTLVHYDYPKKSDPSKDET